MKKIIKITLLASLAGILFSCDNEGELPYQFVDLQANVILKDNEITRFDQNEKLEISIITAEGVSVESIEVRKDGTKIADATIDGSKATFSASKLSPYDQFGEDKDLLYGSFNVSLYSNLSNGKTIDNNYPISVVKALSFSSEVQDVEYKNPYTDSDKGIIYKVAPLYATVDNVMLEWKKNKSGSYVDTGEVLNVESDTINLKTLDYITKYNLSIGDTLYYKVTARKGAISESIETSIAIVTQTTSKAGTNQFNLDSPYYNLMNLSKDEAESELEYSLNTISSTTNSNIKFVKSALSGVDVNAYYTAGDLFNIKDDFEAGISTTSVSNLVKGQLYLYKVIRDSKTYYGMIKIGDILNSGTNSEKITITYKEGILKL